MSAEATKPTTPSIALRLRLDSGPAAIPLERVSQLAGYATLSGEPDDYFLGWLTFHGEQVPVFDLNRVLCEQPTDVTFGTRIILLETPPTAPTAHLGLLAAGVTDTTVAGEAVTLLDLDTFLPMLYTLTPEPLQPRAATRPA